MNRSGFVHADMQYFSLQMEEDLRLLWFEICPNETNRSSAVSHQQQKRSRTKKTIALSFTSQ